jgi:hypothetical protein
MDSTKPDEIIAVRIIVNIVFSRTLEKIHRLISRFNSLTFFIGSVFLLINAEAYTLYLNPSRIDYNESNQRISRELINQRFKEERMNILSPQSPPILPCLLISLQKPLLVFDNGSILFSFLFRIFLLRQLYNTFQSFFTFISSDIPILNQYFD